MSYPVYYVPAGDVLPVMFSSYAGSTGASSATTGLAVTDIEIYKDGGTTQRASDAGYTLLGATGMDFDGITGINGFSIDTGDNTDSGFYTVGSWFHVVVASVTVDSQTVNFIACAFRIMPAESSAGVPKVDVTHYGGTAGTFASGIPAVNATQISGDATAADNCESFFDGTGYAGTNNVIPTVTTLTGHTPQTGDSYARLGAPAGASVSADIASVATQATAIETDTADIQTRLPAALVSGRIDASVGAMAANVVTATAINTGAITAAKFAAGAIDAAAMAADAWQELIETMFTYNATADYAGATAGSLVKEIADNAGGSALTEAGIADAVWDEVLSGHLTAGTTGNALNAAGSAGDPWSTSLPGAYGAGTAGNIIGNYIDAAITSRLASSADGSGFTAIPWNAAWDTEVQSEVNDALVAINLDHLVATAVDTNFATTVHLDSVIGQLADTGTTATFDRTTDSIEAIRNRGDSAWITATGFSTHSAADVWAAGTRTLTGDVTLADGYLTAAKFATGAFTAAKFAAGAIDAAALATDAAQEIRDAITGATLTELSADPGASPTLAGAIMLPYMSLRNKHDTDSGGGTDEIHNNAGTVILTATISDSGTLFTKGKYA